MSSHEPHHRDGAAMASAGVAGTVPPAARSAVDTSRPFGAHLRTSWWIPLVLIVVLSLVLVLLQLAAFLLVGVIEGGDDPLSTEFTPLKSLAANLSIGASGLLAVLALVWTARSARVR